MTVLNIGDNVADEDREEEFRLAHLVTVDSEELLDGAELVDEELLQEGHYDRYPDEVKEEEMGNEGVDATHFYRDSVRPYNILSLSLSAFLKYSKLSF